MNMNNLQLPGADKLINRMFRKVDNVVWDLMSGKLGVRTKDGIVTVDGEGDDAQPVVNLLDNFGVAVPAFAQGTAIDQVKVGDLIYTSGEQPGWVVKANDKSFRILRANGTTTTWTPPKVQMLGINTGDVMVVRSLLNMLPGGNAGLAGMQGMLMPMMLMGDGEIDMDKIMPMMLMSQMGGFGGGDPAAGNAGAANMMQMMLMMQMFKGDSKNSVGNLSGARNKVPFNE